MKSHGSPAYRPDIDGLRAVSVLAVLAFHYRASFTHSPMQGGFTGVDIFFVISGFLINQGLVQDIQAGTFSVLSFYERRIRRILPALVFMLAIVLFAGKLLLMPGDYRSLATSAAASAFGFSNIFFLNHTGYFDQTADLMPLLHTWSLAVEEQFYLVWPVLLAVVAVGRKRIDMAAITVLLAIVGFGASLVWFDADPKSAFFMVLPRAWEFLIGAALVFLPMLRGVAGHLSTPCGLIFIAIGFIKTTDLDFPGAIALLPCVGAALIIWPKTTNGLPSQILGKLAPIGLISYSLYLWHWPIWVLYRYYISSSQPGPAEALSLAATSVAIAAVSYWFVERPFRRAKWAQERVVAAGLFASTIIFCTGMYIDSADGLPGRIPQSVTAMSSLEAMWDWKCPASFPRQPQDCSFGKPWESSDRRFVLWGDSHASHFAPLFDVTARRAGWAGTLLAWCPPVLDARLSAYKNDDPQYAARCVEQRQTALATIAQDPHIRTVILASAWTALVRTAINSAPPTLEHRLQVFRAGLDRLFSALAPLNRRVVIVGEIPQWARNPVACALAAETPLLRRQCTESHTDRAFVDRHQGPILKAIKEEVDKFPGVTFYDPASFLCDFGQCVDSMNGEFLYRDATHLRRNLSEATLDQLTRRMDLDATLSP